MDYKEFLRKSIEQNEKEVQEIILAERQDKILSLSSRSGIPSKFKSCRLDNYDPSANAEALKKAKEFIKEFPSNRGLLLTGGVGTGKTHIATAIANELLNNFYSVYFGNVTDILSYIKSTYSNNSEITEDQAINLMTREVDLFIIDDLGKENETPYALTMLYQLINRIYENEKPVIITTNESSRELIRKLGSRGPAIVSRISEICEPVIFGGRDWRLGK